MRALEFTRLIEEPVTQQDLDRVQSGKPVDPELEKALADLQPKAEQDPSVFAKAKEIVAKYLKQLQQIAKTESAEVLEDNPTPVVQGGIRSISSEITQQYDRFEAIVNQRILDLGLDMQDDKVKTIRDMMLRDIRDLSARRVEKGRDEGQQAAEQAVVDIFGDIDELAKKIVKYEEPGEDAPKTKKAQGIAASALAKKEGMKTSLTAVFLEKVFVEKALSVNDVQSFVKGCVNGEVLDMLRLIKNDHGKIGDFVNSKYKATYDKMYPVLAKFKGEAGTGGALGPGEVLLSAIGNPVGKEARHGDLVVGSGDDAIGIEVKAGSSAKASKTGSGGSGARLNGTSIRKGADAYKDVVGLFKKYNLEIKKLKNGTNLTVSPDALIDLRQQLGSDEKFKNYIVDLSKALVMNFDDVINPNSQRTEKGGGGKITHKSFADRNKMTTPDVNFNTLLGPVINNGEINFEAVKKLITYAQLTSYEATDGVEYVMTLDTHTENFSITKDAVDFIDQIGQNHVTAKNISISANDPQTASFHWRSK